MGRTSGIDLGSYLRAFGLFARNPAIVLPPLLMSVLQVLLFRVLSFDPGGGALSFATTTVAGLLALLLDSFGLAVALIIADGAWRHGVARLDDAWDEARRRAPDILLAAIGFNFIIWAASLVGSYVPIVGPLVLGALAHFFFIYTLPAAAIGGIPGGAALQISLERAQRAKLSTLLVTVVYLLAFSVLPSLASAYAGSILTQLPFAVSGIVSSLVIAFAKSLAAGYVALVLARAYNDASYGRVY